jgi:CDP-4-dehydro-6-deoxyglucose reductase
VARITLVGESAVAVDAGDDETVLAALHRSGHAVRSGCRRGGCGICKVDVVSGDVHYTHPVAPSVLTDDERVEGVCLSCRAVADDDVEVRLREHDQGRRTGLFALYATLGIAPPS